MRLDRADGRREEKEIRTYIGVGPGRVDMLLKHVIHKRFTGMSSAQSTEYKVSKEKRGWTNHNLNSQYRFCTRAHSFTPFTCPSDVSTSHPPIF